MRILTGDLFIFSILILIYTRLQKKFPNFFYPLTGIVIMLPPSDEEFSIANVSKDNNKKSDKKGKKSQNKIGQGGIPLKFFKGTHEKLKNLTYSSDVEFIIMFSTVVSLHIIISELFKNFIPNFYKETVILLFLCVFFISYATKILFEVGLIGGLKIYEVRINAFINLGFIALLSLIFYQSKLSILFNFEFQEIMEQTQQHFFYIFANQINFYAINVNQFVAGLLVFSGLFAFALLPSILIFCQNYVSCFMELKINKAKNSENNIKINKKEQLLYDCLLILNLLILCLWLRNIENLLTPAFANYLKLGLIIIHLILSQRSWVYEIANIANKNYSYLQSLSKNQSTTYFQAVKQKCNQNVQILGLRTLQICCKTTIPLIIFLILIANLKVCQFNNYQEPQIQDSCLIQNKMSDIFFSLSKCSVNDYSLNQNSSFKIIAQEILNRGYKYGFFNKSLFIFAADYFLFIYYLLNYVVAVPYIYFLKKSYEI